MGIKSISYDDYDRYVGKIQDLWYAGKVKKFTRNYLAMVGWVITATYGLDDKVHVHGFYDNGKRLPDNQAREAHENPGKFC